MCAGWWEKPVGLNFRGFRPLMDWVQGKRVGGGGEGFVAMASDSRDHVACTGRFDGWLSKCLCSTPRTRTVQHRHVLPCTP